MKKKSLTENQKKITVIIATAAVIVCAAFIIRFSTTKKEKFHEEVKIEKKIKDYTIHELNDIVLDRQMELCKPLLSLNGISYFTPEIYQFAFVNNRTSEEKYVFCDFNIENAIKELKKTLDVWQQLIEMDDWKCVGCLPTRWKEVKYIGEDMTEKINQYYDSARIAEEQREIE